MVYYTGKLIEKGIQTMRFGKAKKQNNLRIHPLSPSVLKIVCFFCTVLLSPLFQIIRYKAGKQFNSYLARMRNCKNNNCVNSMFRKPATNLNLEFISSILQLDASFAVFCPQYLHKLFGNVNAIILFKSSGFTNWETITPLSYHWHAFDRWRSIHWQSLQMLPHRYCSSCWSWKSPNNSSWILNQ